MNLEYYDQFENRMPGFDSDTNSLCLLSIMDENQQNNSDGPNLRRTVGNLLNRLDSDIFVEREMADRALRQLGRDALPHLETELRNPRSAEVRNRVRSIYIAVSGANEITFNGNTGRDGVGRLREIRDNMSIIYRDGGLPGRDNQVDAIGYDRAGGWNIVRQGDGTYTISQNKSKEPMESGARISMDQRTGNVRATLRDGSVMIIPPAGPRWWYREGTDPPPVQD